MRNFEKIGVQIPRFLLPRQGIDLTKWAVLACDQFTSQPEYWRQVEEFVGEAPSTLKLIFPEIYLEENRSQERIASIQAEMRRYLDQDLLVPHEGLVYVERSFGSVTRHGLLVCLDLEKYDYHKNSQSLIRATEGTILERLPPRMNIRRGAALELPHVLVLIDDPQHSVIEPLKDSKSGLTPLYDFELMFGSGYLAGWLVREPGLEKQIVEALEKLASPGRFAHKYGLQHEQPEMLYAVGDGNHSLATAKAIWEEVKGQAGREHPARYALVEIENVHDPGLAFKPIHRLLFDLQIPLHQALRAYFKGGLTISECASFSEMIQRVNESHGSEQVVGLVVDGGYHSLHFTAPCSNLPVGTLQGFLDAFMERAGAVKIDYVHGDEVLDQLGCQNGNAGFYLPPMPKSDLFKTVILDGVLPRKTFSMGEAKEKRFYMEARQII